MRDRSKKLLVINTENKGAGSASGSLPSSRPTRVTAPSGSMTGVDLDTVLNAVKDKYLSKISDDEAKGFINFLSGIGINGKPVLNIKRSIDDDKEVPANDTTIPTTLLLKDSIEGMDGKFLRKDKDDRSVGRISTDKGFEAGRFVSGFLGGTGAWIGADGYGEMSGLTLREFLEVPELRFNRIDVVSGELWNAVAFGMVEEVDTENRICKIKLEENERCGLHVGDFCRGIFADFGDGNNWEGEDECGFMHLYGFWTSYFTPTKILDNEEGLFRFEYELKPDTTQHPTQSMKFAVYGHPTDKKRQASAYATRTYKRYLNNVDTWVIHPDSHIYAQYGDLNGLQIDGVTMQGYGSFQSNAYFRGVQIQLPPEQMESLKGDSAYAAQLTSYVGTVKLDADGNMIGGISEETNVTALDENGVVSNVTALDENGVEKYVVVTTNKLTTTVQAYKGSTPLYYSSAAVKGGFTLSLDCVGCTASVVNGAIIVNSVTNTKDCRINITVNCEGMAVYNLEYNVVFVQDGKKGQNVSMYEISPGTNIIKETSSGVEPSTISFTSWKREGGSRIKFEARWIVFGWKDSKVEQATLLNDTNNWSNSYTYNFTASIKEGYKYFEVKTDDGTFELATSEVVLVKDGEEGEKGVDAVSYRIEPNIQTISKTMTGTLSPESVKFMLQANKGGVIKYYDTYWSLKGRNLPTEEWTTLNSANKVTSFDVNFTDDYKYYELSAKTYGDGDVMLGDTLNISIVADGKDGEDGASGAMPRYRGEFVFYNESEPYVYNNEYRDIVLYEGNVYQVYQYSLTESVTAPPSIAPDADNDGKWQRANKFRFVAMDTALIDNANIGGFTFARKKYLNGAPVGVMRSQYGPICISSVDKSVSNGTSVGLTVNNSYSKFVTIRKFDGVVYELVPSTLTLVRRKNDNDVYVHDTATVSCSVKTTGTGGSGYTLKYSKDGGSETTGNSVSTSGVISNITFILYSNNVEIGRQVIPVLDDGSTIMKVVVEKETLCLKVDNQGNVVSGLPFRVKAHLYKGATEIPITSLNLTNPSGVEAVNELVEIDTESGTLKCTNVDLTGVINAVGGVFRDISTPDGEFHVDGDGTTWIGGFRIKNNGLTNIDKNNESKSDAYILFSNTSENRKVSLGGNVLVPSTGVAALGQLESKKSNSLPNYALLFDVVNSSSGNFAFCGNGSGVLSNMVCGYGVQLINGSANTITRIERSIVKGNKFWVKSQSNTGIGLPPISAVREALDITSTSVNFSLPITIMNRGSYDIRVWGKNTALSSMNNSNYPILDGEWWIKAGHSMDVVLGYCNGEYVAFIPVAYN